MITARTEYSSSPGVAEEGASAVKGVAKMPTKYLAIIERCPRSYGAYAPDLPGCVAAAKTAREARKLIRQAIRLHIEDLRERGLPVPKPMTASEIVTIKVA